MLHYFPTILTKSSSIWNRSRQLMRRVEPRAKEWRGIADSTSRYTESLFILAKHGRRGPEQL